MVSDRSTRFFFVLLAAVLFALHFQIMPRPLHHVPVRTLEVSAIADFHNGRCNGDCCGKTSCCIQAALSVQAASFPPPSARFAVAYQIATPLLIDGSLDPPPRTRLI